MSKFKIATREIGMNQPPFLIAEMSGNHKGSLERALEIVDAAAKNGADAIKLQTYTADTMTLDLTEGEFRIEDPKNLWTGRTLYDLYKEAHTPWEWHQAIFERAKSHGLLAFSTPFDLTAVEFLESLGAPAYKIASFENVDLDLIRAVSRTKKPVIISTGMANFEEITEAVDAAREAGCTQLALLKCTSSYPAPESDSNLKTIPELRARFGVEAGLSDHTLGLGTPIASIALGASIIEKHLTLSRTDDAVDSAFSMTPADLSLLRKEGDAAWRALGTVTFGPTSAEIPSLQFRRSLYFVESLPSGTVLKASHIRAIRPGLGLAPKFYQEVLGKTLTTPVKRGTALHWDQFESTL